MDKQRKPNPPKRPATDRRSTEAVVEKTKPQGKNAPSNKRVHRFDT